MESGDFSPHTGVDFINILHETFSPIFWRQKIAKPNVIREKLNKTHRGTIASVVIQAIGSGTNEETLMKATHPMIRLGQFGTCTN